MSSTSAGPPAHRKRAPSRRGSSDCLIFRMALAAGRHDIDGAPLIWQPSCGSQESCVHVLPSLQSRLLLNTQAPLPLHLSTVQTSLSKLHAVIAAAKPFGGQGCPAIPLHASATSQTLAAARHSVPIGFTTSAGHGWVGIAVQCSLGSQNSPEPARHTVEGLATMSGGHPCPEIPVQRSSGSQRSPDPARQRKFSLPGASSIGHGAPGAPVHSSVSSQTSPVVLSRQMLPAFPGASSGGQATPATPLHTSL